MGTIPAPTVTDLASRLDKAESRYLRAEKRFRVLCGALLASVTVVVSLPFVSPAVAQGYGMTLAQAATRIAALETKTASMSAITDPNAKQPTVRFTGVNVQVVSGEGSTEASVNGTGNLIIGYNELRGSNGDNRMGSHNLIVGLRNNYSGCGGAVMGNQNSISNYESCVTGGYQNTASGVYSSVSGGLQNTSNGYESCVSGGYQNTASGPFSSVSGGEYGVASGWASSVSGGYQNTASSGPTDVDNEASSVSGGALNVASGNQSSISGGVNRTLSVNYGWAAGSQASGGVTSGNFSSP